MTTPHVGPPPPPAPAYVPASPSPGCRICQARPALEIQVSEHRGLIIAMSFRSYRGHFCRTCAISLVRTATTNTLCLGWWSPLSLICAPGTLIWNAVVYARVRKMERPVARPHGFAPRDEGPPLVMRPLSYVALLPAFWYAWVIANIVAHAS